MFLVFAVSIGYGIRLDLVFDWMWYSIGCGIRLDVVFDWMCYSIGFGLRLDVAPYFYSFLCKAVLLLYTTMYNFLYKAVLL